MFVPWLPLVTATVSTPAQTLLLAEMAMLLAGSGSLVALERSLAETHLRRRSPRPSTDRLAALRWTAGVTALLAVTVGAIAIASGHLAAWERTLISGSLLLLVAALGLSYLSLVRAREKSPAGLRAWSVAAVVVLAFALTTAFLAVDPEPSAAGVTFPVYGTCLSGGCGLKQRSGPGPQYPEVGPRLRDGDEISIVCRVKGAPVAGHRSPWWDRLPTGAYVSDAFIDRPKDGRPPYVRLCERDECRLSVECRVVSWPDSHASSCSRRACARRWRPPRRATPASSSSSTTRAAATTASTSSSR